MSGELKDRINVSLQAVAQILLVCGLGVYLAKKHGLDRAAIAAVSGVNWHVLIPCLMFSSIVAAVTPSNLVLLWPMLLVSLLHIVIGLVPAFLLGWVARLPRDMWFFAVMASSLPNCGNLPWLFMPSIISYYASADQAADQIQYMVGLVSVYTIITIVVTLTVPFLFKRPPNTLALPRRQQRWQQQDAQHDRYQQQQQQQQQPAANVRELETVDLVGNQQQPGHHTMAKDATKAATDTSTETANDENDSSKIARTNCSLEDGTLPPDCLPPHQCVQTYQPQQKQDIEQQQHGVVGSLVLVASHSSLAASFEISEDDVLFGVPPVAAYRHTPVQPAGSVATHRSSSGLLQHGSALLGSFSKSLTRSLSTGFKRSESMVRLVWSYPLGWHARRDTREQQMQQWHGNGGGSSSSKWAVPKWLEVALRWMRVIVDHPVVNVPLGATVLGIACAAIGPVRQLLVPTAAPLHWLWLGFSWVGAAAAPLATMQIGAELVQAAPVEFGMRVTRRAQWSATTIAIVVKLVLVPLINIALVRKAGIDTLVPSTDTVYQLLLLVEAAVPAAVTLLVVCGRVYPDIRPLSQMLFWQYVASMVTLPCFLVWFMYMLQL